MASKHPELFAALAKPFSKSEVRTRPQGGRQLEYITARHVMNRLDEVLGPENWSDEYEQVEHGILCKLTIWLPDGSTVTKCDAGGHAGMADQGDDEKSGFSDAFKRAAVKFGIGRELYRDGTAKLAPPPVATPQPSYRDWLAGFTDDINRKWRAETGNEAQLVASFQLNRHLLKALDIKPRPNEGDNLKDGELAWRGNSEAMLAEAKVYCRKLWRDAKTKPAPSPAREPGCDDMPSQEEEAALDRLASEGPK
jgi:hypothetical protein